MDGRGRLAQPLTWIARHCALLAAAWTPRPPRARSQPAGPPSALERAVRRLWSSIVNTRVPRGAGIAASSFIIVASTTYGVVKGDHIPSIIGALADARDQAANALGFRIATLALSGQKHVSREEILAVAGVTGRTSLLFLDVDAAREKLKTNPWVADATVLKLYPGELQIGIKEREAFALWQKDGRISVIAADGTVLEPFVVPGLLRLPRVVGRGAEKQAKTFLDLLARHPDINDQVRAAILVGERRWNLRLRNGIDVRLPEAEVDQALELLSALDREKKLVSRDIVTIDLRLPDRVIVRQSEGAAQARSDALKDKKPKPKEGRA